MSRILIIAPHPDDAEIGMGGTIARFADQGHDVTIADMTDGSPTPLGDRATRLVEAAAANTALSPAGRPIRRVLMDFKNREITHSLEARHRLAGLYRAVQAEIVFIPHFLDAHPDHIATTRIAEDARFDAKLTKVEMPTPPGFNSIGPPIYPRWLFYYYCSHLRRVPDPSFIVDTTGFEARKRASLEAYRTQFVINEKNRHVLDMIAASDAFYGSRINTAAGEPFFTHEPIGLASLAGLVS